MIIRSSILLLVLSLATPAWAAEHPSDASVRELLAVMQMEQTAESTMAQMDQWMASSMQQAMADRKLTAEQQAIVDEMHNKMIALMSEELSWAAMESTTIDIYRASFTQNEIDGMLEFYKSDAGKAVIAKMPVVMQNSMELMQAQMSSLVPKIQKIQAEMLEKLKATES